MNKLDFEKLTFSSISETELKNFGETLKNFSTEHNLLEELLKSYKLFIRSFKQNIKDTDLPTLQMFFICFREFLISTQLVGQGHFSEAYTIMSRASEAVGYGLIMKKDVEKAKIWIAKSGKKDFKKLFGEPFPKGETLLHPTIFSIYNVTRDYGSHANFGSTMHFTKQKSASRFEFVYSDFDDVGWIKRNLLTTLHSFTEFMIVFKNLFDDNLEKQWLDAFDAYVKAWISYRDANKALFNL